MHLLVLLLAAQLPSPKPAPEMEAQAKVLVGTWMCESVLKMGGSEQRYPSTIVWTRDLGGFWLSGRTQAAPGAMKIDAVVHLGFDARTKTWIEVGFDSQGGWVTLQGKGAPGYLELSGKGFGLGQEMALKTTLRQKSEGEVSVSSSVTGGAGSFAEETTCRRKP